jgi:hypothetical protein
MKTAYPLPLELTRPIELASPLENEMAKTFGVGDTWYNPVTQVRETPGGVPRFVDCGGTSSSQESESTSGLGVIDVQLDIQVDDNDF